MLRVLLALVLAAMVGLAPATAEAKDKSGRRGHSSRGRTFSQQRHNRSHSIAPRHHGSRTRTQRQGRSRSVAPRHHGSRNHSQGHRVSPRRHSRSVPRHYRFAPTPPRHRSGHPGHGIITPHRRGLHNNDILITPRPHHNHDILIVPKLYPHRPLIVPPAPHRHHNRHHGQRHHNRYNHHRHRTLLVANPYQPHCPYTHHGLHCRQYHPCPYDQHGTHCGSYYHPIVPPICLSY